MHIFFAKSKSDPTVTKQMSVQSVLRMLHIIWNIPFGPFRMWLSFTLIINFQAIYYSLWDSEVIFVNKDGSSGLFRTSTPYEC